MLLHDMTCEQINDDDDDDEDTDNWRPRQCQQHGC